jgi:hypothetical protein
MGALLTLGTGAACGGSSGAPEGGRRSICPSCAKPDATAGTETSDFSGSTSGCESVRAPLPPGAPGIEEVERMRAAYAGIMDVTLRWENGRVDVSKEFDPATSAYLEAAPTGYSPETRVAIDVALGDTEFFDGRPTYDLALECPDWLRVPATITLSTEDGALATVANGSFDTIHGVVGSLSAQADLRDVVGTLDLMLDPEQSHRGVLSLEITASNEGKRGSLRLEVSSEAVFSPENPLRAAFPDDGCNWTSGFPISPDAPLGWANGQSADQVLADWSAALSALQVPAAWSGCVPVDVRFELGGWRDFCAHSSLVDQQGRLDFTSSSRLITVDGRMDTELPKGSASLTGLSLHTSELIPRVLPVDFAAQSGIVGVDAGDSPWLESHVGAVFERQADGIRSSGHLRVEGTSCEPHPDCDSLVTREILVWPPELGSRSGGRPYCE